MLSPERPVLSVEEVLQIIPIDRVTLYRMFKRGDLVCRKLGHRTLVRREDLQAFLDGLPVGPAAAKPRRGADNAARLDK